MLSRKGSSYGQDTGLGYLGSVPSSAPNCLCDLGYSSPFEKWTTQDCCDNKLIVSAVLRFEVMIEKGGTDRQLAFLIVAMWICHFNIPPPT